MQMQMFTSPCLMCLQDAGCIHYPNCSALFFLLLFSWMDLRPEGEAEDKVADLLSKSHI